MFICATCHTNLICIIRVKTNKFMFDMYEIQSTNLKFISTQIDTKHDFLKLIHKNSCFVSNRQV